MSLPFIDPAAKIYALTNDMWKKVYETAYNVWSLPGNSLNASGDALNRNNQLKERTEAGL
ncbi:hypothetical protein ACFQI7_15565 [Paenibacillus allorhizosphaerae]|uniref:hypothetical protein n=1 Tax=Paenibacillus allorhizosphaerae TaxID=2849866 RepID=UPI001C4055AA|nr:hypothetical protein [Paenibacillus allorhizosphaerae]